MAKTVVALYDDFDSARRAVEALVDGGFERSDISLVANDASGKYAAIYDTSVTDADVIVDDEDVSAGEGAGFGAVVGALVGLGVALIPGIGPVIAAGPLAAALMAGIGAATGAVTGGVVASLVDFGVPEEHAVRYAEGVRRGGALLTVHLQQDEWADRAQTIMNRYNPVDIDQRSTEWHASGWTGYDESAAPHTADQINASRMTATGAAASAAVSAPVADYQPYAYYEPRFRTNYDMNYANSGYDYTMYDPAYRYGYTLATDPAYRDRDWMDVESEVHSYWDANYPGTWERVKNSIRDAWYEVTGT
jgi:uncharacterized membrane protein